MVSLRVRRNRHDEYLSTGVTRCLHYRGYGQLNTPFIWSWRIRFREPVQASEKKLYGSPLSVNNLSRPVSERRGTLPFRPAPRFLEATLLPKKRRWRGNSTTIMSTNTARKTNAHIIIGYDSPYADRLRGQTLQQNLGKES